MYDIYLSRGAIEPPTDGSTGTVNEIYAYRGALEPAATIVGAGFYVVLRRRRRAEPLTT